MSVLMPNARLGLRRRVEGALNSHGERTSDGWGSIASFEDGMVTETAEGGWRLGLDPSLWPVRSGDLVVSSTGLAWLVETSDLLTNSFDSTVNWVRVTAMARQGGHTVPSASWFVARFESVVTSTATTSAPTRDAAGLWTGTGPPPEGDFGAQPGDEYIDLLSGTVYTYGDPA